ncbi:hypothetical protein [Priestia flexa]|uniref:Uncharacterized protein n=1 Tax=Priestia flexa TaxID=86664 RepID=A0ABU4J1L3_9BACI|nr:hypothetical protein [Priestia flexa]MCG7314255.1 hypothetical protein [Priestia flexa]MDW8514832.1 hypothetical protein [Priestia flexa]
MNIFYKIFYLIPPLVILWINNFYERISLAQLVILFFIILLQLVIHLKLAVSSKKNHYINTARAMVTISIVALIIRDEYLSVLVLNLIIITTILLALLTIFTLKEE